MDRRLLQPLVFRNGRAAPNRLWLAPLTNGSSHADGQLSDAELGFLVARADGGFGVIESCASHISLDGQGWAGELGLFDDALVPGWRRLAAEITARQALLIGQAYHGGARAMRAPDRPTPWSCSPSLPGEPEVAEGSQSDIEGAIAAFAAAAGRLEAAGAQGVELHGAHGYLPCQFLSSTINRRTDAWGGALENRARFIRRALQAARAAVTDDFLVGVRLSPESYPGLTGIDLDESVQVAAWLSEDGADFVHLSLWNAGRNTRTRPAEHAARIFRDALPDDVRIVTAGKVWTVDEALAQLDHGADAVALGRAAIANPDWPKAVLQNGADPVRPPLTPDDLRRRALSPTFIGYMRSWKGFVEG